MVVLGLDFGLRRIGLAIARTSLAEPLAIWDHDDKFWSKLRELCNRESVELIVVGMSENTMAQKTTQFINQLRQGLTTPIAVVDETLSTHDATVKLRQRQAGGWKRRPVDHLAAAEFLQTWLDEQG